MDFSQEKQLDGGVVQRDFSVQVNGETVPGVVWSKADAPPASVLICMGHGGSQHKKVVGIRNRALQYAKKHGWATLAIDAPAHGDRISREEAAAMRREVGARVTGQSNAPAFSEERLRMMLRRSQQAVPEWQAALDTCLDFDFIQADAAVGYWGVSMGTAIGVPFVSVDPRIRCAVLGLAGLRPGATEFEAAAKKITIPIQFVFQWADAVAPQDHGIALFDAFGSKEKTMHINPGGHLGIPAFESDAWLAFYERHLLAS